MAEDCVCTSLASIYSMQSQLFTSIDDRLKSLSSINVRMNTLNNYLSSQNDLLEDLVGELVSIVSQLIQIGNNISSNTNTLSSVNINCGRINDSVVLLNRKFEHDVGSGQTENITEMLFNKKYQIENLDLGEVAVSNEIIVESQMWSYVGRGEVGFNDFE